MNKANALDNILRPEEPDSRYAQVVRRITKGRYQVKDVYGRSANVDSSEPWVVGAFVVIQLGRIVGKSAPLVAPTEFKV